MPAGSLSVFVLNYYVVIVDYLTMVILPWWGNHVHARTTTLNNRFQIEISI